MIIDNITSDVAKELFTILSYSDNDLLAKIPDSVFKKICDLAADSSVVVHVDKSKRLMNQPVSDDCKDLLCWLYYEYGADLESKKEILNLWQQNDITSLNS